MAQRAVPRRRPSSLRSMAAIVSENPGTSIAFKHHLSLPPCALDNDVLIEVRLCQEPPPLGHLLGHIYQLRGAAAPGEAG